MPTVRGPLRRARVRDQLVAPRGRYLFDDAAARLLGAEAVLANAWNLQRFLRRVNQWERFAECSPKTMQLIER